jgi:hypothetical protein
MSALPPIADIHRCKWDVRKVPIVELITSPLSRCSHELTRSVERAFTETDKPTADILAFPTKPEPDVPEQAPQAAITDRSSSDELVEQVAHRRRLAGEVESVLNAAFFLPQPVRWRLSTTERKRLHAIAHTCGLLGGHDAWWFWPRRHH